MTLKQLYNSINKTEWYFVIWLTLITIILTTLPIIYGYIVTPNDQTVSGLHSLAPVDLNVYYSYLEQVKQRKIVFVDLFTTEKQTPLIFNIFWLSAGWLGKILNLNNILTFQLARILLIPLLIFVVYLFIAYFLNNSQHRKLALLFILFSAGIGAWLSPFLERFVYESYGYYHWPLDLWVPEAITFLTVFQTPHFIASLILILVIFLLTLLTWEKPNWKYEIIAGICALILFQFHPFHLPTIFGVLGSYLLFLLIKQRKIIWLKLRPLFILFLFTVPDLIYHFYILQDPIIRQRAIQNVCLTPAWWLVLIGFGFLTPLALYGIYSLLQNKYQQEDLKNYFLIIWLVIQSILIYSPFVWQRRMTEGLHIVLSLLVVIAIINLIDKAKNNQLPIRLRKLILFLINNKYLAIIIFVLLFSFSNFFNLARDLMFYQNKHQLFYLPVAKQQAFNWIKNNTPIQSNFLAHPTTSNFIAGNTGRFVYVGHTTETPFFELKNKEVEHFFKNNTNDTEKSTWLKQNNLQYLFYSDWEKSLSSNEQGFEPSKKEYLKLVYQNQLVQIYKVKY